MSSYVDQFLSTFMCDYRKGFVTQQALLSLIKDGKIFLIKIDMVVQYLWTFQRLLILSIAKLGAYGFDTASLKLIRSYLTNRFQRTKVNITFSSCSELFVGLPDRSALGLLLFNIYIKELFNLTRWLMCVIMLTIQPSMLVT